MAGDWDAMTSPHMTEFEGNLFMIWKRMCDRALNMMLYLTKSWLNMVCVVIQRFHLKVMKVF